jgi:hypothetical protein
MDEHERIELIDAFDGEPAVAEISHGLSIVELAMGRGEGLVERFSIQLTPTGARDIASRLLRAADGCEQRPTSET